MMAITVASFSHLCYKYIYSFVLTTLCTILYFDMHNGDAAPQNDCGFVKFASHS